VFIGGALNHPPKTQSNGKDLKMFTVSAFSGKFSLSIALILLVFGLTAAQAQQLPPLYSPQQFSTSVGGGTLSWQAEGYPYVCPTVNGFSNPNNEGLMFSNLTFTYNGSTNPVLNTQLGSPYWCPYSSPSSYDFSVLPNGACTVTFSPELNGNAYVSVDSCSPGTQGFINPKYVVVGVTYAPPGSSSYVQYTGTNSVGNTTTISSSFSNDVGFSVSVQNTVGIQGWGPTGTVNGTSSTDYTQGSSNSTTTTLSKLTSLSYKTSGTGNAFSPMDSDYDMIWLWLNPVVLLTYTPATSGTTAGIQWNGYGYDTNDPSGTQQPDVYPVLAGYLNGDFGNPAIYLTPPTTSSSVFGRGRGLSQDDA
jgi:hypothetical protein